MTEEDFSSVMRNPPPIQQGAVAVYRSGVRRSYQRRRRDRKKKRRRRRGGGGSVGSCVDLDAELPAGLLVDPEPEDGVGLLDVSVLMQRRKDRKF